MDPSKFELLGAQVEKTPEGGLIYHHADYIGKVKPITIAKDRMNSPDLPITEGERTQPRAAIGAVQRAATQTSPHLQAHTSYLAGDINNATVATLLEANKMLRFAKANSDVGLEYSPLGSLDELTLVTFSDAAFASRQNHAGQGSFLVTIVNKAALETGAASKYHIIDWRSFKLARLARSTLAAKGQVASEAADAHLFATTFVKAMTTANYSLQHPGSTLVLWSLTPKPSTTCCPEMLYRPLRAQTSGHFWKLWSAGTSFERPGLISDGFPPKGSMRMASRKPQQPNS